MYQMNQILFLFGHVFFAFLNAFFLFFAISYNFCPIFTRFLFFAINDKVNIYSVVVAN